MRVFDTDQQTPQAARDHIERIRAVLEWSALRGTSRHHWGMKIDVIDGHAIKDGYRARLLSQDTAKGQPGETGRSETQFKSETQLWLLNIDDDVTKDRFNVTSWGDGNAATGGGIITGAVPAGSQAAGVALAVDVD